MYKSFSTLFLALTLVAGTCLAQDNDKSEPQKYYKLDFMVKELDGGKTVNSRSYSMTVATPSRQKSEIRTNSRVFLQTNSGQGQTNVVQVQQYDLGTNFDCINIKEIAGGLSLSVTAQVNSILEEPGTVQPIIRRNEWNSAVILPIQKPTVIFSSDDPGSKRQMQVELVAIPIK
jgi:hypothetical protein